MRSERKDARYRQAKAAGYRARSAYKLVELDDRFRLLKRGDRVVDLGAWPGAWLQVAAERVGFDGRLVGLDLVEPAALGLANVAIVVGDVRDPATIAEVGRRLGGKATVVLCDVAPKLTGVRATDETRVAELAMAALDATTSLLAPGGRLLIKLFMSPELDDIQRRLAARFREVKTTRPESSRRGSSELYAVGVGFRAPVDNL